MATFPCDYPLRGLVNIYPRKVLPDHMKAHHGCIVQISPMTYKPGHWNRADNLLIARMLHGEPLIGRAAFRYGRDMVEAGTGEIWLSFPSVKAAHAHVRNVIKKTNLIVVQKVLS
jgi:hypothetical protein